MLVWHGYTFRRNSCILIGNQKLQQKIVFSVYSLYKKVTGVINMGEKLTKRDIEKIEEEIEHRKLVIRKEAIEAVKEARAQGDLSENFEYYAAKKHKNQNESRIRYLERMLKTATVVDDSSKSDEVGMDDIVEVEFEEDGEVEKYKLVTSIRGNSMENRVSIESPIGKALKGHRVGDRVLVNVNENVSYYLHIKSIDKTGDEGEDIRSF